MMGICYCYTCDRDINHLGIARHRAMHRDKKELCTITYTAGVTYIHDYREQTTKEETTRE